MVRVASGSIASVYSRAPMPLDEAGRERAVRDSGIFRADLAMRLHDLVMQARHALRTRLAALSVITGQRQMLLACAGMETGSTTRAESFCGHAVACPGQVMVVPDTLLDPRFAGNPFVIGEPFVRFYAGAPLVARSGHALGTLCVFDPEPRRGLGEDEQAMLKQLAAKAMAFSERATAVQ